LPSEEEEEEEEEEGRASNLPGKMRSLPKGAHNKWTRATTSL